MTATVSIPLSSTEGTMTLPFETLLLAPGAAPFAADPSMLGIEVTDPRLAAACGLGNVDPQHVPGAGPKAPAAIEACLDLVVAPQLRRLATIRPDIDALGAMAILCGRAAGRTINDDVRARVKRIAAVDRFDRGPWPGAHRLPRVVADLAQAWPGADLSALAACVADSGLAVAARVHRVLDWLWTGATPDDHLQMVAARHSSIVTSLRYGATTMRPVLDGRAACVVSMEPGALGLGYLLAPVVVALNPDFRFSDGIRGRKYTLARWAEGDADLNAVVSAIARVEPGWGGQIGIKGSPLAGPSQLGLGRVIDLLRSGLE